MPACDVCIELASYCPCLPRKQRAFEDNRSYWVKQLD